LITILVLVEIKRRIVVANILGQCMSTICHRYFQQKG
jgi:hypothetical protein